MPLDIATPERKTFRLERTDALFGISDDEATTVLIVQARVKQNSERSNLFREIKREYEGKRERLIMDLPMYNLLLKQVYLTMVDCNLTVNDKPLFRFKTNDKGESYLDMKWDQFVVAAGFLPESILQEINEKVLEVNPHWIMGLVPEDLDLGEESSLNGF
jgi:hypothetical protein